MANVFHASLTGTDLHEPKGVASANSGEIYVADGGGSGAWSKVSPESITSGAANLGKALVSDGAGGGDFEVLVWKDLLGDITPKTSGAGSPSLSAFRGGNVRGFAYSAGDDGDCVFHIPHDYAPGTDLYIHLHWAHNGTAISGSFTTNLYVTYAKGHNQENFIAEIAPQVTYNTTDIATTPRYRHRVEEIQLSAASPTATQLDTALIETDGIILVHFDVSAIPTITGGSPNEPFIFTLDIHYQSNYVGTLNKAPNFYA